jgi:hypothetical protein
MLIQLRLFPRPAFVASVLLLLSGCSTEEAVPVVAAKGIVRINGTPAADIMVRFVPEGKQETGLISSTGVSDSAGRFQLVASDGRDGAIPGQGQILLTDTAEERPAQGEVATKAARLPAEYGVLGAGSLTVTVAEGTELSVDVKTR